MLYFVLQQDSTEVVYILEVSPRECPASDSWDSSENNVDIRF